MTRLLRFFGAVVANECWLGEGGKKNKETNKQNRQDGRGERGKGKDEKSKQLEIFAQI